MTDDVIFDLVIIGAGISGLAAARAAHNAGQHVVVIDKGRRIGGRVSTRRADGFTFNHGAQFVTASGDGFSAVLQAATTAGALLVHCWRSAAGTVMARCSCTAGALLGHGRRSAGALLAHLWRSAGVLLMH